MFHPLRLLLLLPFGLGRLLSPGWAAQPADRCVECHTDPAKLQALVRPPAEVTDEEGEG